MGYGCCLLTPGPACLSEWLCLLQGLEEDYSALAANMSSDTLRVAKFQVCPVPAAVDCTCGLPSPLQRSLSPIPVPSKDAGPPSAG